MGSFEWVIITGSFFVSIALACVVIFKVLARQNQANTNARREALQKLNFRFTTKIDAEKSEQLNSILSIQKLHSHSKKSLASGVYRDHPVQIPDFLDRLPDGCGRQGRRWKAALRCGRRRRDKGGQQRCCEQN